MPTRTWRYTRLGVPKVSSRAQFVSCAGEKRAVYIEPFAGLTRDPRWCLGRNDLMMSVASLMPIRKADLDAISPLDAGGPRPQMIVFDFGASTWSNDTGGISMHWLFDTYNATRPVTSFLGWEAQTIQPVAWCAPRSDPRVNLPRSGSSQSQPVRSRTCNCTTCQCPPTRRMRCGRGVS